MRVCPVCLHAGGGLCDHCDPPGDRLVPAGEIDIAVPASSLRELCERAENGEPIIWTPGVIEPAPPPD